MLCSVSDDGPVTVFVPTDAAFEQLPPEQFKKLYQNATAIRSKYELSGQ